MPATGEHNEITKDRKKFGTDNRTGLLGFSIARSWSEFSETGYRRLTAAQSVCLFLYSDLGKRIINRLNRILILIRIDSDRHTDAV